MSKHQDNGDWYPFLTPLFCLVQLLEHIVLGSVPVQRTACRARVPSPRAPLFRTNSWKRGSQGLVRQLSLGPMQIGESD